MKVDPHVVALIVTEAEAALAVALILGVFSNISNLDGVLLAFVTWSTAEGFGGHYKAGSTDIGASIIYVLMFVDLFLSQSGLQHRPNLVLKLRRLAAKRGVAGAEHAQRILGAGAAAVWHLHTSSGGFRA